MHCVVSGYVEKWYVKLLTVTSIKAVKCIWPLLFDSPSYIYLFRLYVWMDVCMYLLHMYANINTCTYC